METNTGRNSFDTILGNWRELEKKSLEIQSIVGSLRFDRAIELIMFRRSLFDSRLSEIIHFHTLSENYGTQELSVDLSLEILKEINNNENIGPARVDIGTLHLDWLQEQESFSNLQDFIHQKLSHCYTSIDQKANPRDVVLYGFGRIGRLLARRIIELTGKGEQLRLRAIVLRPKLEDKYMEAQKRAALLFSDSVHGEFKGAIKIINDTILEINGNEIKIIYAKGPEEINYLDYGIHNALLLDNTGVWRDKEALSQHLRPGIEKVILTAPGKNIPNIVQGVNHLTLDLENDHILCAASCTTNAIAPIMTVVDDAFGIESGHIETIHAYTSDQNLLDNFHKKERRGRAAAINMVLTSTGAAKAVAIVLPHLAGKLTGNAVRVPTPNVSLAIMNLSLQKETNAEELNKTLKAAALHGNLVEQIHYSSSTEFVSSHAVGMTTTSILDAPSTIVSSNGKNVNIYAWYDNEYGYACQVVRLAKYVAEVRRAVYY